MGTDNPAGRLHELLRAYREVAEANTSIHMTWARVLGVSSEGEAVPLVAQVASLIPATKTAIDRSGSAEQAEVFDMFQAHWWEPIIGTRHPRETPTPGKGLIDLPALAALGGISAYLSAVAPDGVLPDAEKTASLRQDVEDTILTLLADGTLPTSLASAINQRLHDVLWAMDHIRINGPEAVNAALERLVGQIDIHATQEQRKSSVVKKVLGMAGTVWMAFKVGPQANAALEGWKEILGELPPGS